MVAGSNGAGLLETGARQRQQSACNIPEKECRMDCAGAGRVRHTKREAKKHADGVRGALTEDGLPL
jgi:hypothetical protein